MLWEKQWGKQLFSVAVLCLLLVSMPAKALSNDPDGEIFITKLPGDIVNCGPVAALMLAKYINTDFGQDSLLTSTTKARKIIMDDKSQELEYDWWKMRQSGKTDLR